MKFRITTISFVLALTLAACGGPLEVDFEGDAVGSADSGAKPDIGPAFETAQPAGAVDNDGDGVVASKDCNDNNVNVHPWAPEQCNGKDDNCDGYIDEGCPSGTPSSTCVDNDKDGFCTMQGQVDCNDQDAAVKPGATEICGNGKDDDCDGVIDEGCTIPTPSGTTTAKVEVTYPDSVARTLNVQVYDDKSDLGGWWDKSASSTSTALVVDLAALPTSICGFRLNVSEGNPASSWLCAGNGSTASLDPDATVKIIFNGQIYGKAQLMTWSAPGGTNAGCSALLKVNSAAACQP